MPLPVFLLGAGFNADVKQDTGAIFGNSIYIGRYEIPCIYPLESDLLRLCFELGEKPVDRSVEDLFADSINEGNFGPVDRLADVLMEADYRLCGKLVLEDACASSHYHRFFERYGLSTFLTFNYDGLVETFLLKLGIWHPHDGYGVPVHVEVLPNHPRDLKSLRSATHVLHLHGSLYVYTSEFEYRRAPGEQTLWIEPTATPWHTFDPDGAGHLFLPYQRSLPGLGYECVGRRVIAPVPDKTSGLKEVFVQRVYAEAERRLREAERLVIIGYSFNEYDRVSYCRLLTAFSSGRDRQAVIVSPGADEVVRRLQSEHPSVHWSARGETFASWVDDGYYGAV